MRHWLIGYARVSKTDGTQSLERDALGTAGVDAANVCHHLASGGRDDLGRFQIARRSLSRWGRLGEQMTDALVPVVETPAVDAAASVTGSSSARSSR